MHLMPSPQRSRCSGLAGAMLALALTVGPVDRLAAQAGFPNTPRVPGTLITTGPQGFSSDGRGALIAFHGGLLYTIPEHPSSAAGSSLHIKAWNIASEAQLANPQLVENFGIGPMNMQAHGYVFQYADLQLAGDNWLFRRTGFQQFSRHAFPTTAPQGFHNMAWERGRAVPRWVLGFRNPVNGDIGGNWFYNFEQRNFALGRRPNPGNQMATDLWAQWDHLDISGGVMGMPLLFGDLLFVASEEATLSGLAVYDLAPTFNNQGTPPTLLSVFKQGGTGGYWPELWGQGDTLYVFFPRRNDGLRGWQVVDVSEPTAPSLVADVVVSNNWRDGPMYAQFQDNFAFTGRFKVDMLNPVQPVLTLPSESGGVWRDTSQFNLPLGNLLVTGGVGSLDEQAWRIWAHQAEPDTRGPTVGYHRPRPNQTHWPRMAPLAFLIHETLRAETIVNGSTVIVRPVGGAAIEALINFTSGGQLNVVPMAALAADTEYEVVFPAGGIQDVAGNGIDGYSFRFSTGGTATGNRPPQITQLQAGPYPVAPGGQVAIAAVAVDPDPGDALQYRFVFGDGNSTPWGAAANAGHAYAGAGRYTIQAQVRDPHGAISTRATRVAVQAPVASPRPTQSAAIAWHQGSDTLWIVNRDHATVSRVDRATRTRTGEFPVGDDPRSVALDGAGRPWVACHDGDRIDVLNPATGAVVASIPTGYGSAPVAVAIAPGGGTAYVALQGAGRVLKIDTVTLSSQGLAVGPTPRAIAITGDGGRVLVTRFISARNHGEVYDIAAGPFTLTRRIRLPMRAISADSSADGRGVPNHLTGIAISPRANRAWITAKKDNTTRGLQFYDGRHELDTDNTVRAQLLVLDLGNNSVDATRSRDLDNSDAPSAIAFSPLGDYAFIALQGNNEVTLIDALGVDTAPTQQGVVGRWPMQSAPQGVLLAGPDLVVQNFLARSATLTTVDAFLASTGPVGAPDHVALTGAEALPPAVARGKRIFHFGSDPRMSPEGYMSCASCHADGGSDGRVWDFSGRGEGLRNNIDLRGRAGMGHGLVHWTGNFDEIQDFEGDIRLFFGGAGFMSDANFAATQNPLGPPKAGLSAELDDLAAYVASLGAASLPRSPHRQANGQLTAAAVRGQAVFASEGCATCHAPASGFRDGVRHNIGTLRGTSGQRLGAPLDGIDTPTLLGVWDNPPYFHDGSADTLEAVFASAGGLDYQVEDGTRAGGASLVGNYIDLNEGNASHGGFVQFGSAGAGVSLAGVNGGTGGSSRLELRWAWPANSGTFNATVSVNGVAHPVAFPATGAGIDWRTLAVEDVLLAPGTANTVLITGNTTVWPPLGLDQVVVSRPAELALAQPHRRVRALAAGDRADLLAWLRELDGRDGNGQVPGTDLIFSNGFQP
jgi:DNA-binding beta-propeller fold protein YncE/mono/diheme cytochrome c family protein